MSKNNSVPPKHITEHLVKFHNIPSMCSRVIVRKQLKYDKMAQFCPFGAPGGPRGGADQKSLKQLELDK